MTICKRLPVDAVSAVVAGLILVGCAASPRFATQSTPSPPKPEGGTESKKPEQTPPSRNTTGKVLLTLEGLASYYADEYHGKLTSNGETFNMNDLTAAHRTFPA